MLNIANNESSFKHEAKMKLHQCKISEVIENVPLLQLNGGESVEKALQLVFGGQLHTSLMRTIHKEKN